MWSNLIDEQHLRSFLTHSLSVKTSDYKHSPFRLKTETVLAFQPNSSLLSLKHKKNRIATTDLEYGALLNDYGESADNFTVNVSSIFWVRI